MGLGAGGSYRLLQGIFFLLPGSVDEAKPGLPGTLTQTHTHSPPRALLRSEEKAEGVNVNIIHHW